MATPILTIIVPSIRADSLPKLLSTIPGSMGDYSYELIIIGPNSTERPDGHPQLMEFTWIEDYGSPSRCVQRAACEASGKLMVWLTDDGVLFPLSLGKCIKKLLTLPSSDGIIVKYTEEGPYSPLNGSTDEYYISGNHDANKLPGIPPEYLIAPVPMYYTSFFKRLGGIDAVNFEHVNMNVHDLAYRVQNAGGKLHFSDSVVMHCNSNNFGADHAVLDQSYGSKDLPSFRSLYGEAGEVRQVLEMNNWKQAPAKWRRFNVS